MTGARISRFAFLFVVAASLVCAQPNSNPAQPQTDTVTLTPGVVDAGSPELIRVAAPAGATPSGEWLGHKLEFFRGRSGRAWFALAGVDVEAPVGSSSLSISAHTASGEAVDLTRIVQILPALPHHHAHRGAEIRHAGP